MMNPSMPFGNPATSGYGLLFPSGRVAMMYLFAPKRRDVRAPADAGVENGKAVGERRVAQTGAEISRS